jgi:hypothetical protein
VRGNSKPTAKKGKRESMIRIPDPGSSIVVADWIELFITTTEEFISKSNLSHLLERASGEEPKEAFIGDIWRELKSREKKYRVRPFIVDGPVVETTNNYKSKSTYIACLLMSLFGVASSSKRTPKLFERLSCFAVKAYLGGEAIVFGWPVELGKSPSIRDRIIEISVKLNERYVESPPEKYKDRGVDVVAWKPFHEQRPSQIVFLLQCAAGQNWRGKAPTLPIRSWEQYIHWSNNPVKAFAVPCIIPDHDWHEISKDGGVLFDRIRITNLTHELATQDKTLARDLDSFVKDQLKKLS